jgi:hypothetical protein
MSGIEARKGAEIQAQRGRPASAVRPPPVSSCTLLFRLIVASLVLPVGSFAVLSGLGLVRLPYPLWLVARQMPALFALHMIASGIALMLIPVVVMLRGKSGWHKALGRICAALVITGGLAALPVALASEAGLVAQAGFFVQGLVWIGLLGAGWASIRRRNVTRHAGLMLAMAAVASGAIWLRLATLAAVRLDWPFEAAYAWAAWASWMLPLAVVLAARRSRFQLSALPRCPNSSSSAT